MAFAVRIEAYHGPATTPMLRLEPSGWNSDALIRDERFKYEPEMQGYDDYVARLSVEEFCELHQKYRVTLDRDGSPTAETMMLDGLVEFLNPEYDSVVVTVFEWSSGF